MTESILEKNLEKLGKEYGLDEETFTGIALMFIQSFQNVTPSLYESLIAKSVINGNSDILSEEIFLSLDEVKAIEDELKKVYDLLLPCLFLYTRKYIENTIVERHKFIRSFREAVNSDNSKVKEIKVTEELLYKAFFVMDTEYDEDPLNPSPTKIAELKDIDHDKILYVRLSDGTWLVRVKELNSYISMPPELAEKSEERYQAAMRKFTSEIN